MLTRSLVTSFVLIAFVLVGSSCSTGANLGNDPENPRLLLQTFNIGGTDREVVIGAPRTATFPALTYYVFGSNQSLGDGGLVPLQTQRLNEQSFGPLASGDPDMTLDLTPWDGFEYIYVRAIVVQPNKIREIRPGTRYEFWGN